MKRAGQRRQKQGLAASDIPLPLRPAHRPEIVNDHIPRNFVTELKPLHQRVMIVKSRIDACEFHLGLPLSNVVEIVGAGCAGYGAIDGYP